MDDLDRVVGSRPLPDEVAQARRDADANYEFVREEARKRMDAHLLTCETALATLDYDRQRLADQTDLDLTDETRQAATWQISGRCIGLARCLLAQLRAGFCGDALPTARTLHECTRLLEVVSDPEEDEITRRWLRDADADWVRAGQVRAAIERAEGRLRERMIEAGADPIPDTTPLSRALYDRFSWAAHNRRGALQDAVSVSLRRMAIGSHPDPLVQVQYVAWGSALTEEVISLVGDSLSRFYGTEYFRGTVRPLQESLVAVRVEIPLDPDDVQAASQR